MIKLKPLIISLLVSLGVGGLSAIFTMGSMDIYKSLVQPPLAPPSWLFPIVWTILFILMGISAYMIYMSSSNDKNSALTLYAIQLIFNFLWSIIFFNLEAYLFAFIWLILLFLLILAMVIYFYRIDKIAGILQLPYLLWVCFAGYLNFMIYLLN